MKVLLLSGSNVGSKTRTAMDAAQKVLSEQHPDAESRLIDLSEMDMVFSDGRNYLDYEGDTKDIAQSVMDADALIIGTPIFQASIPAALKNVFDLLPTKALLDKVASILVTAGSSKHYLIAEQQLKPILNYMKAQVVPTYVFIEDRNFLGNDIVSDDVLFRIGDLVADTMLMVETYKEMKQKEEASFGF